MQSLLWLCKLEQLEVEMSEWVLSQGGDSEGQTPAGLATAIPGQTDAESQHLAVFQSTKHMGIWVLVDSLHMAVLSRAKILHSKVSGNWVPRNSRSPWLPWVLRLHSSRLPSFEWRTCIQCWHPTPRVFLFLNWGFTNLNPFCVYHRVKINYWHIPGLFCACDTSSYVTDIYQGFSLHVTRHLMFLALLSSKLRSNTTKILAFPPLIITEFWDLSMIYSCMSPSILTPFLEPTWYKQQTFHLILWSKVYWFT